MRSNPPSADNDASLWSGITAISVLQNIAAIRSRPGMYVGDAAQGEALNHLLWTALSNCIDQFSAGQCDQVWIEFSEGNCVAVRDNGPGFLDIDCEDLPILTHALTRLHQTASLTGHSPHDHLTEISSGLVVVAALSSEIAVQTIRDGTMRSIMLDHGEIVAAEQRQPTAQPSGTCVTFRADAKFVGAHLFDPALILPRLREIAALSPGLSIHVLDRRELVINAPAGIADLLPMAKSESKATDSAARENFFSLELHVGAETQSASESGAGLAKLSVVLQVRRWPRHPNQPHIRCFANRLVCQDGPHRRGFLHALERTAARLLGSQSAVELRGFDAVVRLELSNPRYASPSKDTLSAPEFYAPILRVLEPAFARWLQDHPELVEKIAFLS